MKLKSLCAVLPAYTVTALLPGPVHIIESKHILDSADLNAAPDSLFNSLGYRPLRLDIIVVVSPSVQMSCRVPSNLLDHYT